MNIKDLKPSEVWYYFGEICKIPRPSKKEEKIRAYLRSFAKEQGLDLKEDEIGNIVIYKAATNGCENMQTVILQGHVDMVCEKNSDTIHDFETDPIETYVDGDWLKAKGTTLGADNGLGAAAALAILASKDIRHGALECLFTVDEETGLNGAQALGKDLLDGKILINLDTEEEGEVYVGCAGGKTTNIVVNYESATPPINLFWFKIQVNGLKGGHSGTDIDKGLGNANKILNRYLWTLNRKYGIYLADIKGGNLHNAIPREASATVGIAYGEKESAIIKLNVLLAELTDELKHTDANVNLAIESTDKPTSIIDKENSDKLLNALYACPHGVLSMSFDVPGMVETSTNLASVKMGESNTIQICTSQRSSVESLKDNASNMVNAAFSLVGAQVKSSDGYPGWKPNADSAILKVAEKVYCDLFATKLKVMTIHAGLECGIILEKYPQLDIISCGPTITDAHSPSEQTNIPSVDRWWTFLLGILADIPQKN